MKGYEMYICLVYRAGEGVDKVASFGIDMDRGLRQPSF